MSLFSDILSPFHKVVDDVEALVPTSLLQEYGSFAHTLVAAIKYDAERALAAGVAEAKTLTKPLIAALMAAIKMEAETLVPEILSGKLTFANAISAALAGLKSEAVTQLLPGLKVVGEETLITVLRTAVTTALATASANPTSLPVSSQAALSPASSKA